MLSPTFYDKLDPKYRERLLQLEEALKLAEEQETDKNICLDLFVNFSNQFIMPKVLWDKVFNLIQDSSQFRGHKNTAFYQFYFKKPDMEWMEYNKQKLYDYEFTDLPDDVKKFCYPHINLQKTFEVYQLYYACSFIPKSIIEKVERMKFLYCKIKSVEENVEEWIKALLEAEDKEFVEDNIEYRIGQDLTNKKLWKLYIEYLKKKADKKKLLQAYSKYCRFFLDDSEMLKEYRETVGNQKVSVPWKQGCAEFRFRFRKIRNSAFFFTSASVKKVAEFREINAYFCKKNCVFCGEVCL
uniref:Uncharacterized protein n=1 Tax=Panagrolaimus davidi TaxID=227884 RepID=A0A914NYH0_9BILA